MTLNWARLKSRNIKACLYFRETRLLVIEFNSGSVYAYANVPWSIYMGFRRAKSHGSFHYYNIRKRFIYQKLERAEVVSLTGLR